MDAIFNCDPLDSAPPEGRRSIYETQAVMELIDYKWGAFARQQHSIGSVIHYAYVIVLILYINHTYLVLEAEWDEETK